MLIDEKVLGLKDGRNVILRSLNEKDAEEMIEFLKATSEETYFLMRYREEVIVTLEQEQSILKTLEKSEKHTMIGAFVEGKLVGSLGLMQIKNHLKTKHRATFGISIKKEFWGKGLGTLLIEEAINTAKILGYEQIEIGVFSDNERAKKLYERFGFEVWGSIKNAYKLKDGTYRDEITMGKFL